MMMPVEGGRAHRERDRPEAAQEAPAVPPAKKVFEEAGFLFRGTGFPIGTEFSVFLIL